MNPFAVVVWTPGIANVSPSITRASFTLSWMLCNSTTNSVNDCPDSTVSTDAFKKALTAIPPSVNVSFNSVTVKTGASLTTSKLMTDEMPTLVVSVPPPLSWIDSIVTVRVVPTKSSDSF